MPSLLRTLRASYDHGHEIGDHDHAWGQLVHAASGAIHVTAAAKTWLIPQARAVWLPPRTHHHLRMRGATRLRTIYVPPAQAAALPAAPLGLSVTGLFRELILEVVRCGHLEADNPYHHAIGTAFMALLQRAQPLRLALPMPADRRAHRAAQAILADPANDLPLADLARASGASLRTLQRRFLEETGMPLAEWRQSARLMQAAAHLLDGDSITSAALQAGYAGTSAFIHAFKKKLGETPTSFRTTGRGQD